jgi:fucose 4-O-acetylase-like acetyltransferase
LVLLLSGVALALSRVSTPLLAPLRSLGRASLLVYWVHLEFAFGAAARPLLRRLDLASWSVATCALIVAMWLLAILRERTARSGWSFQRRRIATS